MPAKITLDLSKFKEQLQSITNDVNTATRPAAQAGAQIVYDRAKQIASSIRSKKPHYFYIEGRKYGPFQPGNLYRSIYQVYAESKSFKDVSTYEVSFNKDKAPYGFAYEFGNSKRGAKSFIGRAVIETRAQVRQAVKQRFIDEVNKK